MPMTRCPLDKGTSGQILLSPFEDGHYSDTLYKFLARATSALKIPDMVSPQRALRYPYNKVQGPPTIVGWTKVVSTTPAWVGHPHLQVHATNERPTNIAYIYHCPNWR